MENIKDINLTELLGALLRKIWLILLCAVVVGSASYIYTVQTQTPMYRASISIYVNNTVSSVNSNQVGVTSGDLATSQRLVQTYITILQSDRVMSEVSAKLAEQGIRISSGGILGRMSAAAVNETEVFRVYISDSDPARAQTIANTIADVAPAHIGEIVRGSSTQIIDRAKCPTVPYSPNERQSILVGMAVGAVLAAAFVVLQMLLDVRVKNEEDLAAISSAPVLGLIPDLEQEVKGGYAYKNYAPNSNPKGEKEAGE